MVAEMDKDELIKLIKIAVKEVLNEVDQNRTPEVLTLDQACKYLQVSNTWLKANLTKLKIPYFKTGRHYKFNLEELREWTRGRQQQKQEYKSNVGSKIKKDIKVHL